MIVVADTSALFAAFDAKQREHKAASRIMESQQLAFSPLVIAELDHLLRRDIGFGSTLKAMEAIIARLEDGQFKLSELQTADLALAHDIRQKYRDLGLDFADAVGVVLADRYQTNRIFTLDERDFRAITPLTPKFNAFQLLPVDEETAGSKS